MQRAEKQMEVFAAKSASFALVTVVRGYVVVPLKDGQVAGMGSVILKDSFLRSFHSTKITK